MGYSGCTIHFRLGQINQAYPIISMAASLAGADRARRPIPGSSGGISTKMNCAPCGRLVEAGHKARGHTFPWPRRFPQAKCGYGPVFCSAHRRISSHWPASKSIRWMLRGIMHRHLPWRCGRQVCCVHDHSPHLRSRPVHCFNHLQRHSSGTQECAARRLNPAPLIQCPLGMVLRQ